MVNFLTSDGLNTTLDTQILRDKKFIVIKTTYAYLTIINCRSYTQNMVYIMTDVFFFHNVFMSMASDYHAEKVVTYKVLMLSCITKQAYTH